MAHKIHATTTVSVSELKKNLMGAVAAGEGLPVAILNRNEPVFFACRRKPTKPCWSVLRIWSSTPSPMRARDSPSIE